MKEYDESISNVSINISEHQEPQEIQAPGQQMPMEQIPMEQQAPVQQAPVQQAPVQQAPVQQEIKEETREERNARIIAEHKKELAAAAEREKKQREAAERTSRRIKDLGLTAALYETNLKITSKTLIEKDFKATFTSRQVDRERKKHNKRSRLYQKDKNAQMIESLSKEVMQSNFAILNHVVPKDRMIEDTEDLMDLAAFMSNKYDEDNRQLVKNYLGEGNDEQGKDVQAALDMMLKTLLSEDVSDIRMDSDKAIAQNTKRLERLSGQIACFA